MNPQIDKAMMFLMDGLALPGHLVDGSLSKRPSQAQLGRTNRVHLLVGLLSEGRSMRCWCNAVWAVVNLVYRDMSSHWGKEPDLVWILCPSLTVSGRRYLGSPLRMVWTLHDSVGHWSLAVFGIYRPNV